MIHPHKDDEGFPVKIHRPHTPTDNKSWTDSKSHATTIPGHTDLPSELNGVKFAEHKALASWKGVKGQGDFEEPHNTHLPSHGKKQSVGIAMVEKHKDGSHRVWVAHPTNQFGGYHATLPKGTVEHGLNMRENAIKETFEETGLKAKITGHLGDTHRTTSVARYYTGEREGGHPSHMGWESQAVSLVPVKDLHKVMTHPADQPIVNELQKRYK